MHKTFFALVAFATVIRAEPRVPVIVELFTSEGCSSCPPADSLLAELEKTQPLSNVEVIVLSEHVDYWNSLGWRDPFSAKAFTERQGFYAKLSGSGDVYTPEAVIDGHFTSVGSSRPNVLKALASSGEKQKAELPLSLKRDGNSLFVEVPETNAGEVWIAVTQSSAVSHVEHGENAGRTLQHVGIVRSLTKASKGQVRIEIQKDWPADLRVVAFVQDAHSGRIVQAVQKKI